MWHLQQNECAKLVFWSKLVGISTFLHIILLGYFFIFYRSYDVYHLMLSNNAVPHDAPVVFLPLYKRVGKTTVSSAGLSKSKTRGVKKASKKDALVSKQKVVQEKSEPTKKNTELAQEAAQVQEIKNNKKLKNKKEQEKKVVPVAKELQELAAKQEIAEIKESVISPQEQPVSSEQQEGDDAVYVGQEEMLAIQLQQSLTQEVVQHWKVPAGLSKDLVCEVAVVVNWQGEVQNARIAKTSGVLMYDISARTAVVKMKLPKIAWGKEFIITFKQ